MRQSVLGLSARETNRERNFLLGTSLGEGARESVG